MKACLPRQDRRSYTENKILAVALGGFLPWATAGLLTLFLYFLLFFPLEQKGAIPFAMVWEPVAVLLRLGILGAVLASLGGIAAALFFRSPLCGLLFLPDPAGTVFSGGPLAVPAPVGCGNRRLGTGEGGAVALSPSLPGCDREPPRGNPVRAGGGSVRCPRQSPAVFRRTRSISGISLRYAREIPEIFLSSAEEHCRGLPRGFWWKRPSDFSRPAGRRRHQGAQAFAAGIRRVRENGREDRLWRRVWNLQV